MDTAIVQHTLGTASRENLPLGNVSEGWEIMAYVALSSHTNATALPSQSTRAFSWRVKSQVSPESELSNATMFHSGDRELILKHGQAMAYSGDGRLFNVMGSMNMGGTFSL
ncbi:hypothetical protein FRB94_008191 [Tulasnella sp. JGI-2019a]|nr:hypothetical protein FRB93_006703 [Tulasnella sp. JGI-2019a]KAG8996592.1 hypothetical protein FRB94_008191 [Tulasnella sp. JGI-2019a]KAG9028656.1 hypothetical protein FRB95_006248 [Tulasnella sp. JGI-2019a]